MKKIMTFFKKIFEFFRPGKSYLSCEWLENGMIFDTGNLIRVCCFQSNKGGGRPVLLHDFDGRNYNFGQIFDEKNVMRSKHRKGEIIPECQMCPNLIKKKWDKKNHITKLLLTHWIDCNSNCLYCPAVRDEELKKRMTHYNIVPVLKEMIDLNVINKNTLIDISGGEASIYPEFDEMMELLFDNKFKNIIINSSGIKLSESILKGLGKGCVNLIVSLDAGSKDLHQSIKQVASFDKIVDNLSSYMHFAKDKNAVRTKYILLPRYNDDEKEVLKWLLLNKTLGIKNVLFDIEIAWYSSLHGNIPERTKEIISYAISQSKMHGIKLRLIDRALMVYNEMKIIGAKNV